MVKTKRGKLYLALIAVFAAAILLVVLFGSRGEPEAPSVPTQVPQVEEKIVYREVEKLVEVEKTITGEMIQDGLNDMGVLITQEYYFTEVISFSSIKKLLKTDIELKFTETSYLASYDGTVSAGIDFGEISVIKNDDAKTITVHIPRARIQGVDIDPESFTLYSEKIGVGNPLSTEDFNASLIELENNAKLKALDKGIIDKADENAKRVVSNFIEGLIGSGYSLEIVTG